MSVTGTAVRRHRHGRRSPLTYATGATNLQWWLSSLPDFATFRLYRGTSQAFVPGPANLLAEPTGTGYSDPGPPGRFYKLSAVDRNGNEGPYAVVGPQQTTDAPTMTAQAVFALDGARPNPAVGRSFKVQFSLPVAATATLELFDVAGRRLASRAVGALGPGPHIVDLAEGRRLASGLYLVRLTQGASSAVTRAIVIE